jgi:hypothetical protein
LRVKCGAAAAAFYLLIDAMQSTECRVAGPLAIMPGLEEKAAFRRGFPETSHKLARELLEQTPGT